MPTSSFQSDSATAKQRKVAREKVPAEKGIYRRWNADGKLVHEIAYLDRTGKQRWETIPSSRLTDARRRRAELVSKRPDERQAPSRDTFAEVAEQWFEAKSPKLRDRTRAYYRQALDLVLLPRFGRMRVAAIDADAIATLTRDLEREGLHAVDPGRRIRPLGRSSIENYLKPLQGSLAFAARRGWIAVSPFTIMTADDRPTRDEQRPSAHEWTSDELAALLDASRRLAAKPESRYDYSSLLLLTATLGLRIGEVLGLQWGDFDKGDDADSAVLRVERQWLRTKAYGPTKTRAGNRTLAVPGDLREVLIALRLSSSFSQDSDPIFAARTGGPLCHRNVTMRGFEAARDKAGLPLSLVFHDLRHAAASRLIAAGVDDVLVADQIGHGDSRVTRSIYAHVYDRAEKMAAVRAALAGVGAAAVNTNGSDV
jgi:integrase